MCAKTSQTRVADATSMRAGAAKWPDPPWGGGEEYLGLWRKDQVGTPPVLSSSSSAGALVRQSPQHGANSRGLTCRRAAPYLRRFLLVQIWFFLFRFSFFYSELVFFIQIWFFLFRIGCVYSDLVFVIQIWLVLFQIVVFYWKINILKI